MRRPAPILGPALCALMLAAPAAAQDAPRERPAGRIVVAGEGRVAQPPDVATLRLGAQAEAPTAAQALDEASRAARALIETLRGAGVAEADMQTSEMSLSPRYGYRDQDVVEGYVASNVVTVRIRDLDALGGTLDAAAQAGANRIDGLTFELSDPAAAQEEARRRAVEDARLAAETLAEAGGIGLGRVLRIEEGAGGARPVAMASMVRAESASVPIAEGEVETVATVRMVFALEPAAPE